MNQIHLPRRVIEALLLLVFLSPAFAAPPLDLALPSKLPPEIPANTPPGAYRPPRLIKAGFSGYPSAAIGSGWSVDHVVDTAIRGEVVVDFILTKAGKTKNARAVRSTNKIFEEYAVMRVDEWVFEPALLNGQPIELHMQAPVVFDPSKWATVVPDLNPSRKR